MTDEPQAEPSAGARRSSPASLFLEFLMSRAGNAILSLATLVLVTRSTPMDTAGVVIVATGFATLLFGFLDLGTGPGLVRQAARGDQDRQITVYIWTRALLTAIVVVIGALATVLLFEPADRPAAFLSLGYVAASMYGVLGPIGQVRGNARPFRIVSLLQGGVVFAAIALMVAFVDDPSAALLVGAYSIAAVISSLTAVVWLRGTLVRVPWTELRTLVPANLRSIAMLGFATGAGSIYLRIDQTLVLRYLGDAAAAHYGLAARIVTQARLVPGTLQFAIGGFLAARHQTQGGLRPADVTVLTRIAALGGIGVALGVIALADLAVLALGGPDYDAAVTPAVILGAAMVSTTFNYVIGTSAIMAGKDRRYLEATLAAAVFNIAANVVLVPRYGLEAAALIAAGTELVALLLVRSALDQRGGALSLAALLLATAAAATGAAVKLLAVEAGLAVNVAVSLALVGVAAASGLAAVRALRALPHEDTPPDAPPPAGAVAPAPQVMPT